MIKRVMMSRRMRMITMMMSREGLVNPGPCTVFFLCPFATEMNHILLFNQQKLSTAISWSGGRKDLTYTTTSVFVTLFTNCIVYFDIT